MSRYDIMNTSNGFMVFDTEADDYLHDANGDNCFDDRAEAIKLIGYEYDFETSEDGKSNILLVKQDGKIVAIFQQDKKKNGKRDLLAHAKRNISISLINSIIEEE